MKNFLINSPPRYESLWPSSIYLRHVISKHSTLFKSIGIDRLRMYRVRAVEKIVASRVTLKCISYIYAVNLTRCNIPASLPPSLPLFLSSILFFESYVLRANDRTGRKLPRVKFIVIDGKITRKNQ